MRGKGYVSCRCRQLYAGATDRPVASEGLLLPMAQGTASINQHVDFLVHDRRWGEGAWELYTKRESKS